ncbi:MAG: hypothetical protein E6Q97_06545 [Desulfurellales bacterium]|nr:MAG: hypothetical protein E6Q97_06545 [Desulfurellales bacterium]
MQTFLPHSDFHVSAACLDSKRLGKQRVEAKQILTILANGGGWSRHPAVLMWKGYETSLAEYGFAVCQQWKLRGYRDTLLDFFAERRREFWINPPWLGDDRLHSSHRAALLWKEPGWYSLFGWEETPRVEYFWPTKEPVYA